MRSWKVITSLRIISEMGQFFIVCINLDSKFNLKSLVCIYDVQNVVLGTFETLSCIGLIANISSVIFKNSACNTFSPVTVFFFPEQSRSFCL